MKKLFVVLLVFVVSITALFSLTACENENEKAIERLEKYVDDFNAAEPDGILTENFVRDYLLNQGFSSNAVDYAFVNSTVDWSIYAKRYTQEVVFAYSDVLYAAATWCGKTDLESVLLGAGYSIETINRVTQTIDWNAQLLKYVQHLSDVLPELNRTDLQEYLQNAVSDDVTMNYWLENADIDWNPHAYNASIEFWQEYESSDLQERISIVRLNLGFLLFTETEIDYATNKLTSDANA